MIHNFVSKLSIVSLLVFASSSSQASSPIERETIASYWITPSSSSVMNKIADQFEVVEKKVDSYKIYVKKTEISKFLSLAPNAKLEKSDIHAGLRKRLNKKNGTLAGYHSFSDVEAYLNNLVAQHPDIAQLEVYGRSKNGRQLYALKLSDNVQSDEDEPEVMITAATHGDELITVEILIGLIDQLLAGYNSNERLTKFINERELYFIPVVNPDGFVNQDRYANGADPNRNYPWPEMPVRNSNPAIASIMDFYNSHNFKGSIDIHASGGMIMYPWAYTYDSIIEADDILFGNLAAYMAEENGYANGSISHTIYVAKGSSADYYYWQNGGKAFAYEVGNSAAPPASQIPAYVRENTESTWRFLESFN